MSDNQKSQDMKYETFDALYKNNTTKALTERAKQLRLTNYSKLNKKELVLAILEAEMEKDGNYYMEGILMISNRMAMVSYVLLTSLKVRKIYIFQHLKFVGSN